MKHNKKILYLIFTTLLFAGFVSEGIYAQWPTVKKEMRPWTRWWWMGSAVNAKETQRLLRSYHHIGLGGVEIVSIYGAKGFESSYIPYLSPRWLALLDSVTHQAASLGMGVDMSVGSGWPVGGKNVSLQDAASRLLIKQFNAIGSLRGRISLPLGLKPADSASMCLQSVVAYDPNGSQIDLTGQIRADGTLDCNLPTDSVWTIYACFLGKTFQQVKRAAPGGEGYVLDPFSSDATFRYFEGFRKAMLFQNHGIRSLFNDSYEVFGADWTNDFLFQFNQRRGYRLERHLKDFVEGPDTLKGRLKSDYRQTLSELLRDGFTRNFSDNAKRLGTLSTNQAHGSPGNLLDLYGLSSIPETETFGAASFHILGQENNIPVKIGAEPDPLLAQFASSAAHLMGRPLCSSETFTWLTEHFRTPWSFCKPQAEMLLLSGINHIFYHGTTYSPQGIPFPGWLFYASVNFVPSNSLWDHLKGLNDYITKCQSVLQQGKADGDLICYWPIFDLWDNPEGMDMPFAVGTADKWLDSTSFGHDVRWMRENGYLTDFVSDSMLSLASVNNGLIRVTNQGASSSILFVPEVRRMPSSTFANILRLAKGGATILMQQLPQDVPGLSALFNERKRLKTLEDSLHFVPLISGLFKASIGKGNIYLCSDLNTLLSSGGLRPESIARKGLEFIRRKMPDGWYYFIVNHTSQDVDDFFELNATSPYALLMDPLTGQSGVASIHQHLSHRLLVRLQLKSGESVIVRTLKERPMASAWKYINPEPSALIDLSYHPWQVRFTDGGPVLPASYTIDSVGLWTDRKDTSYADFSGKAVYKVHFLLPGKPLKDYLLDLGIVRESAHVFINGHDAGIWWSYPFCRRIGSFLHAGYNTIEIEVANLMANRIRFMDRNHVIWRNYHEINFVNINYKPFDASSWPVMPSGLKGPVRLYPLK